MKNKNFYLGQEFTAEIQQHGNCFVVVTCLTKHRFDGPHFQNTVGTYKTIKQAQRAARGVIK